MFTSEETGYDVSCVISCLVQLMLDPEYRTQQGFASLVQREWVVMGHPFQRRNHLVQGADSEQVSCLDLFDGEWCSQSHRHEQKSLEVLTAGLAF